MSLPVPAHAFTCSHSTCQRIFTRNKDLRRHEETHDPQSKRFACTFPGCGHATRQRSNLKTHMKKHTNTKDLVCPEAGCDFATGDPASFIRHRQRKHGYQAKPSGKRARSASMSSTSSEASTSSLPSTPTAPATSHSELPFIFDLNADSSTYQSSFDLDPSFVYHPSFVEMEATFSHTCPFDFSYADSAPDSKQLSVAVESPLELDVGSLLGINVDWSAFTAPPDLEALLSSAQYYAAPSPVQAAPQPPMLAAAYASSCAPFPMDKMVDTSVPLFYESTYSRGYDLASDYATEHYYST